MAFDLATFVDNPSVELLQCATLRKSDWTDIGSHYEIEFSASATKSVLRRVIIENLIVKGILPGSALNLWDNATGASSSNISELIVLKKLEIEATEKLKMLDQKEKEREREHELKKLELQVNIRENSNRMEVKPFFDISKYARLIPVFDEYDPGNFFLQFEKLAESLQWPVEYWSVMIQTVLIGKAKSIFISLTKESSQDYNLVKDTILRAYDLVPEACRQKFRNLKKSESQTYVEFAADKERLFQRWIKSQDVDNFEDLVNLILLEEFKRSVYSDIKLYVEEREVTTLFKAATSADNYALTHRLRNKTQSTQGVVGRKYGSGYEISDQGARFRQGSHPQTRFNLSDSKSFTKHGHIKEESTIICYYCKQRGHVISVCPKLTLKSKAKEESSLFVNSLEESSHKSINFVDKESNLFEPFIFSGFVSSDSSCEVCYPVQILRDTGASHSILVKGSFPFLQDSYTGDNVVLQGVGGAVTIPLAQIYLRSNLVSRQVTVGVQDSPLPVDGVTFLLGNDIAGRLIVPDPIVNEVPLSVSPTEPLEKEYPNLFPSCAVTRSMAAHSSVDESLPVESNPVNDCANNDNDLGLSGLFSCDPLKSQSSLSPLNGECNDGSCEVIDNVPVTREMIINAQREDKSLAQYFDFVVDGPADHGNCFYLESNLLMRKYRSVHVPTDDISSVLNQVVVPAPYRRMVISIAHDFIGGHLGVNKTYNKILRHFYWPKLRKDVCEYCRTCHLCQLAGKRNVKIPPAPLKPIPVVKEPFSHIIIDCVGPLPKTKNGNSFLLTIMCATTRYPEVIPLRRISSKIVIKALIKFFTQYGIPRSIQSDQGSNFTSGLFQQVMNELAVKQYLATAYHPESQGALERFHQTFKSMLKKYCKEMDKDWDEGVHLLLFAIRESKQESLGFAPFELVFGHEVRGPLKVLKESWITNDDKMPLLKYVQKFRARLSHIREFASANLKVAQSEMKAQFDKKAVLREFKPGQLVLAFLPRLKNALQSSFSGPYRVKERRNDVNYVIETPNRRKTERLVHINLLKPYHSRVGEPLLVQDRACMGEAVPEDYCLDNPVKLCNGDIMTNIQSKLQHLTLQQSEDIECLLVDFRSVCQDVPRPCRRIQHDVVLTNDSAPIKQAFYRVSPARRQKLREEVDFLLANGLAEPSDSEWASPCLLVPKSDGGLRLCTDYRKVNTVTRADSFPLPRLDDLIDGIGKATYVTKIDLLKGYYQVALTERAKRISAFVTPDGLYQYCVMPFGMCNAPATFQRLMNTVTADLDGVQAYLDDVIVVAATWEDHLTRLRALFTRLAEAELTINLSKCEFGHATVIFLGHVVGQGQVAPVAAKIEAIQKFPRPDNRKSLLRFLGMAGYYRRFCPNFSQVTASLTDLVSPKRRFEWTPECQTSFERIRALLTCAPVLQTPDFTKPFSLQVDACDTGTGAVLLQSGPSDVLHPVCYLSTKLKKHQRNYSTIEKKTLSLLVALEKFSVYISNVVCPVIVYTDHNPLKFLDKMKNKNQRLMRWALFLQQFNLEIRHIKGKDNILADVLSRV